MNFQVNFANDVGNRNTQYKLGISAKFWKNALKFTYQNQNFCNSSQTCLKKALHCFAERKDLMEKVPRFWSARALFCRTIEKCDRGLCLPYEETRHQLHGCIVNGVQNVSKHQTQSRVSGTADVVRQNGKINFAFQPDVQTLQVKEMVR